MLADHYVTLSGQYTGDHPSGVNITFGSANYESTTTDANGAFTWTTASATLGQVSAVGVDSNNETTNTAYADIELDAPVITDLTITQTTTNTVTVTGTLTGLDIANQTILFAGIGTDSTTTDANGDFSATITVTGLGVLEAQTTDLWGQDSEVASVGVWSLPASITVQAEVIAGRQVRLTGTLSDVHPGGATVYFSGAVSGETTTDGNGAYDVTLDGDELGTVYAYAVSDQLNWSDTEDDEVEVDAPIITVAVDNVTPNEVTISGTVSGVDVHMQKVTISGILIGTVFTDANGDYTFTGFVSATGAVTVSVTDPWGQSDTDDETVSSLPTAQTPLMSRFGEVLPNHQLKFWGTVLAPNPENYTITFGGNNTGTTTLQTDGSFVWYASQPVLGVTYAQAV